MVLVPCAKFAPTDLHPSIRSLRGRGIFSLSVIANLANPQELPRQLQQKFKDGTDHMQEVFVKSGGQRWWADHGQR